jgi:hypothetical protein
MTEASSTPPTRRRAVYAVVIGLVAVVAAGGAALAATREAPAKPTAVRCTRTPTPQGRTAPADAAPGGGGLRVVEKGFTQLGDQRESVSIGALVENTSDRVAYRTLITFRVLDAGGRSVTAPGAGRLLRQEVPVIMPGQRFGVGSSANVQEEAPLRSATVSTVEVRLERVHWTPRRDDGGAFAAVTAEHWFTDHSGGDDTTGVVRYDIDSPYCDELTPRGAAVVFRDRTGALIGGSFDRGTSQARCKPGRSDGGVLAFESIPAGADDDRTEIYPYCDLARPDWSPTDPNRPIN